VPSAYIRICTVVPLFDALVCRFPRT